MGVWISKKRSSWCLDVLFHGSAYPGGR